MQKDMHFYGTYAVARIAGFAPEEARIVATADQFVDDATLAAPVSLNGRAYLLPVVSSHGMFELAKNSNTIDQWQVWLPFHFLPGNQGNDGERRLICLWGEPDNHVAEAVLNLALGERRKAHGLHFLGLVGHVLQDTYAHYGFCGMASDRNRIDQRTLTVRNKGSFEAWAEGVCRTFEGRFTGSVAEETRLGHASVATFPDLPYLKWGFRYKTAPELYPGYDLEERDNPGSFYLACTRLHALFRAYRNGLPSMEQSDGHASFSRQTSGALRSLLGRIEPELAARCGLWRERIADGSLFPALPEDRDVAYDDAPWRFAVMENNAGATLTHAYLFNRAARRYLDAVLTEVLPGADLLVV
ncbi:hypothetical protein DND132_3271 [Pseudodesulfovibrio mercurii]|uniref:Uncharacterized protein n=1 Tax=Pseudodesulfovibrio mercurii TaxID=641491 RepID=F0JKM5_9BACT|nr:DUF6765 family protein [Pseudodesulfovibrio mercurii]EGB16474.1 hypothetical protein DND132_3271 [Pseudodesulfovibrio mercurii]